MKGKICLVTGGNAGIGYETALALAKKGATVSLICRNGQKALEAVEKIIEESGNKEISYFIADLSSRKSITEVTGKILEKFPKIDVLINNAGTWFSELTVNEDGVEMQFAVNYLSHFLLSHLLLGALQKSGEGRILNVGSDSHKMEHMHFDDLNLTKKYHGLWAYAQSKLADLLFTYELDRKLKEKNLNITVNCIQPGLVKTDIGLKHTKGIHGLAWKIRRLGGVSPAKGALTSIYLASSPEVKGVSGKYWDKCKPKNSSKDSYIEEDWKTMWKMSSELYKVDDFFSTVK